MKAVTLLALFAMMLAMVSAVEEADCDLRTAKSGKECTTNQMCYSGCCKPLVQGQTKRYCSTDSEADTVCAAGRIDYEHCPTILGTICRLVGTALVLVIVLPIVGCCLITIGICCCCYYCKRKCCGN